MFPKPWYLCFYIFILVKNNIKFTILTILSVYYSCVNYIHLVQKTSRNFSSRKTETLYLLNNKWLCTPPSHPWWLSLNFLSLRNRQHEILHISGIMQDLSFCDWFISLSIMSSSFIHVVAYNRISLFF